jgi:hypothetical protein
MAKSYSYILVMEYSVVKSTAIFVMEYSVEKSYSYLCNGVQCGKELQLSLYWSTVWTKLKGYSFCMIQFYSDFASK